MSFFNLQNTMESKIKGIILSLSAQEIILIVVSVIVVIIVAKLSYNKYKNRRFNKVDLQIEHTLKHQE